MLKIITYRKDCHKIELNLVPCRTQFVKKKEMIIMQVQRSPLSVKYKNNKKNKIYIKFLLNNVFTTMILILIVYKNISLVRYYY